MRSGWLMVALVGMVMVCARVGVGKDVEIAVRDLGTHQPVAGAVVTTQVNSEKKQTSTTDAEGKAHVVVPEDAKHPPMLRVWAEKEGMVRASKYWWAKKPGDEMPASWELLLEPATTISGQVMDDAGKGVAGAHVVVEIKKKYGASDQRVSLKNGTVVTDGEGRWRVEGVPAVCDSIALTAWHHMYLTGEGFYYPTPFADVARLRDGTARIALHAATRIEGLVRGPDGAPVKDATVYYNADRRVSNQIPPVTTDAEGKFVLGIKAGTAAMFIVEREGFAPAFASVQIGKANPQVVEIALKAPSVLSGRVVDGSGKGIAGVHLWVHGWHGRDNLDKEMTTDADGKFSWDRAPDDEVTADMYGDGLSSKQDIPLQAGKANEIRVSQETKAVVTVLDAATGEPVPKYQVRYAAIWHAGERKIWQGLQEGMEVVRGPKGFTYTVGSAADESILRVEVEGYMPEDAPAFASDGLPHAYTVKLQKADPLAGQVVMADGSSSGTGNACFVSDWMGISNGEPRMPREVTAAIDSEGKFKLQLPREKGILVITTEKGVGFWQPGDWEGRKEFVLQAWGVLEGQFKVGEKPVASVDVMGYGNEIFPSNALPQVSWQYGMTTDAEGRFRLDHVWPGKVRFVRMVPNHAPGRMMYVTMGTVDMEAGKTQQVQFGGSGHAVVGQLAMNFSGKPWMERIAEARPAGDPKGHEYDPEISDDGKFRIEDVPAGEYVLKVALHEFPPENACGWGRVLGEYTVKFTVPALAAGEKVGAPIDLGMIASAPVPTETVKVGDVAPDFAIKTIEGREVRLSELKGKIVLLDFWATWCAPCVAEIPHVKEIAEAHAGDSRFVLLGMNEDEETNRLKYFLEQVKVTWPQALLGEDSDVAKRYGATAIPATVLIGADGKVIARDLRGEALKKAVAEALGVKP